MNKKHNPSKLAFFWSSALFIFVYGVAVGVYEIFPYGIIKFAHDSALEVWRELPSITQTRPEKFLTPARYDGDGVTRLLEEQLAPGLTFITGFFGDTNEMRLIRHDGEIVNRWPVRFSEVFPDPAHIEPAGDRPANDWGTDIHGALALPDGSVVFNFEYMGMVKLDRCGNVQWILPRMTHHSIDLSNDGSFWVGGRRYVEEVSAHPPIRAPYHEDTLLKVSPEGAVVNEISVPGLFFTNNLHFLLFSNGHFYVSDRYVSDMGDLEILHLNDIEELGPEMADQFPQFAPGDLLLSMRHLNLIMVVDPDTLKIRWRQTGPYIRQHDPDFRADGIISVFNNNTDDNEGKVFGGSNIINIDPKNGAAIIQYGAGEDQQMYTELRGKHQILWNGNILIAETLGGRVFEITGEGDIVWEFINRFDKDNVARLNGAIRYPADYFTVEDWSCG